MKLTVYIPCYNAAPHIAGAIRALLEQTRPADELLVIDDGSTDNTVEIASRFPVRVIRHEKNKGLAAARNTAFASASHEFVGAIDADVFPARDWLENLLAPFADPRVVGTGGRLLEAFQQTTADAWRAQILCQDLGAERLEFVHPTHKRLGGFGTIFRKQAVESIGGYNEKYRTNYEDVDLCARLLAAGHKFVFEPRAVAYHQRRDSIGSVIRTAWRWDFYFHYFRGGYNHIALKLLLNFRAARALAWSHLRSRRFSFLLVDFLMPWIYSGMDLRYHFSGARLPRVEASREESAVYVPRPFQRLARSRSGER
jgi:glycosyltransferase involved in cell wall biosynthesis